MSLRRNITTARGTSRQDCARGCGRCTTSVERQGQRQNSKRNECSADDRYLRWVVITREPLSVKITASSEVQGAPLAGRNAHIPRLNEAGAYTHPRPAIPSSDGSHFPTSDHIVERRRDTASKMFSPSEGEIVQTVEGDAMGGDGGVVI